MGVATTLALIKAAGGGGATVVNCDLTTYTLGMKAGELLDAIENGYVVIKIENAGGIVYAPVFAAMKAPSMYVVMILMEGSQVGFTASSADDYPVMQSNN